MAEEGAGPPMPQGAGSQDWLKLSSFDATSFFAQQQLDQDLQRAAQGQRLQAAADLLLPSSSDDYSSSDEEAGRQAGDAAAARRSPSLPDGRSAEKGGDKKRKRQRQEVKDDKRRRKEKERHGKDVGKRRRESEREQQLKAERQKGAAQRASQVRAWAPAGAPSGKDAYYFDTRGDAANLAFNGLYRMDVALYRRCDPARFAAGLGTLRRWQQYGVRLPTETDGHAQRDRTTRYFAPGSLRRERNARLKRWRRSVPQQAAQDPNRGTLHPGQMLFGQGGASPPSNATQQQQPAQSRRMELPSLNFLPLVPEDSQQHALGPSRAPGQQQGVAPSAAAELAAEQAQRVQREGETNEEMLLRRTKEFNVATRERPLDVSLWLEFARFQDEVVRLAPSKRGGERGAAEKKIAVLEKALSLHPGSDELLLALLKAAEAVCDDAELGRRWKAVLARHEGSPRLWVAYLHHRRTRFSNFSAVEVAEAYDTAFAALHRAHRQRATQGAPAGVLAQLECDAAAVAVEGAQLRFAAGATEHAIATIQVLLEFNFLSPEGWPEDALEAMFEDCWRSGAALLGQPGAAGWASWIAGEPASAVTAAAAEARSTRREQREAEQKQQEQQREAGQGQGQGEGEKKDAAWSGWEELGPAFRSRFGNSLQFGAGDPVGDGGEEGAAAGSSQGPAASGGEDGAGQAEAEAEDGEEEEEQAPEEETDEQLLQRLGMHLDAALEEAATTLTPPLLDAWLASERQRQAAQWQPRRAGAAAGQGPEGSSSQEEEEEEEEAEHRTVAWREVRPYLWLFESEAARQQLLVGCLQLLGTPLPGGQPSNSPAAAAAASGADEQWQAAAMAGCHPGNTTSNGGTTSSSSGWAAQLLRQGDWGWLVFSQASSGAKQPPPGLRQQPWYQADAGCQEMLRLTLAALARGPARQASSLVQALLSVASGVCAAAAPGPPAHRSAHFSAARELAKQLLAEQRTNLTLWHAYASLEVSAGSTKAARKVYQACFATAGRPVSLAAAAAAAPLVLGAAKLELQLSGGQASASSLPAPEMAAPIHNGGSLLPFLLAPGPNAAVARAARQLAWLGSGGAVPLPAAPNAGEPAPLSPEEAVAAKRGFQDHLLALMQQQQRQLQQQLPPTAASGGGSHLSASSAALIVTAAAFEQVYGRLRGDVVAGVKAALAVYDQMLSALMPQELSLAQQGGERALPFCDSELELLHWQRCQLAADAAHYALPCAAPRAVREALLCALRLFPASAALLQLLVAHESAGHTFTQLRRELRSVHEQHPSPQVWLAMLAVEVTTHSPAAVVQATLERAVASPSGTSCPLLWRCYMRFEAYRGRLEAVRRVFLRAIGACPWSKAVWCDGLALLNGHTPPKELSEYIEIMKDKELVLRTDVFEVVLAELESGAGGAASGDAPEGALQAS